MSWRICREIVGVYLKECVNMMTGYGGLDGAFMEYILEF
jgi:hypothetical protein